MIKDYLEKAGNPQETIFEVIQAGGRAILAIDNTVDMPNATYNNNLGTASLQTICTDPEFDVTQSAESQEALLSLI